MGRSLPLFLPLAVASSVAAQTIDQIRDEVRNLASAERYSLFVASIGSLLRDGEMTGGKFQIDSEPSSEVTRIGLPIQKNWFGPKDGDSLRFEGTLGYSDLSLAVPDIWSGALPGQETRVTTDFAAWTVDVGIGPSVALGGGYLGQVLVHGGLGYLSNDAEYSGPGAAITRSLLDGILFNWDGLYGVYGASAAVRNLDRHAGSAEVRPMLRYDVRQTESLDVDDVALNASDSTQWMTARCDVRASLGVDLAGKPLHSLAGVGYRRWLGSAQRELEFVDFYEVTGGLDWDSAPVADVFGTVRVTASLLLGEDIHGWSVGGSASF